MMIPIVVFLSPRLRRWIRRLVTYEVPSDLWAQVRPKQQHDHRQYTVLMELVPSLQPWSLQETAAW